MWLTRCWLKSAVPKHVRRGWSRNWSLRFVRRITPPHTHCSVSILTNHRRIASAPNAAKDTMSGRSTGMNALPLETIQHILTELDLESLCCFRRVCGKLNAAYLDLERLLLLKWFASQRRPLKLKGLKGSLSQRKDKNLSRALIFYKAAYTIICREAPYSCLYKFFQEGLPLAKSLIDDG